MPAGRRPVGCPTKKPFAAVPRPFSTALRSHACLSNLWGEQGGEREKAPASPGRSGEHAPYRGDGIPSCQGGELPSD